MPTFAAQPKRMNLDRNTLIGLLLMLLLGLGFSWYSAVQQEKQAANTPLAADSTATATPGAAAVPVADSLSIPAAADSLPSDSLARMQEFINRRRFGAVADAMNGEEREVVLRNDKIRVTLSTLGGMFTSATLVDGYTRYASDEPIALWDSTLSAMSLKWMNTGKESILTSQLYFTPSAEEVNASSAAGSLVMRLNTADPARTMELVYTLQPGSYAVACEVRMAGLMNEVNEQAAPVALVWNAVGRANEKGIQAERSKCSVYFRPSEDDRDYLSEGGDDEVVTEEPVSWVAFKQDFFSAAVISEDGFRSGSNLSIRVLDDSTHTKAYSAALALPQGKQDHRLTFFFGPNDYKVLKSVGVEQFDRIIDYGWGIIGWVNKYAVRPLFWFLSSLIGSFGLIILIVTIIIKMLLFPVTWKNYLSSAKMRVLKPEMDEINKKFEGKEAVEKQQAVMALYRQTGVNPFAGCIPVLIQMPILYAMFRFFPAEIVLRGESFLWAEDLAAYDALINLPVNIPFYGAHISGFTLLMAASTFVYTRMSSASQPTMTQPGMPNMKVMMNIFTVMMIFFFNSMPSGLSLYYFTANMISIGQMWVIKNYIIDEGAIRARIEENKKKPRKKSSFQQRLEEAQKAQQKKLDARKQGKK
jgi:YidC/Oxa1 family membrane protein insertase